MKKANDFGVALSGGGYRATVFHLGTLKKLHELGILDKIDVLSTISGGSIIGAAWCLSKEDYPIFHARMIKTINTTSVIGKLLRSRLFLGVITLFLGLIAFGVYLTFTKYAPFSSLVFVFTITLFLLFQYKLFPISGTIEKIYDRVFFKSSKLKDLKERPLLAIGSSNLQTGRPFTFSGAKMSDSAYEFEKDFAPPITFNHKEFPVARAVTASCCVPSFFSPVGIHKSYYTNPEDFRRVKPVLVDGGVYDNQGIQKITEPKSSYRCNTIIVSDAGGNFRTTKKYPNVLKLLLRTVDLFMFRIKTSQMIRHVYNNNINATGRSIAYFSLGWKLSNCIPGFVNNMVNGLIPDTIFDLHDLKQEWKTKPADFKIEITEHLKSRIGFAELEKRDVSPDEWDIATSVSTSLTKLSEEAISSLIKHAENLTEVQVKLYCPILLTSGRSC